MRPIVALAASVAAHVLLLALPAGLPFRAVLSQDRRSVESGGAPAPLTVRLSPYALTTPRNALPEPQTRVRIDGSLAPVLHSDDLGFGGRAPESRSGTAMLPPSPRLSGIPVPRYLASRELTKRARMLGDIDPSPDEIGGRTGSGRIVLAVYIGENGAVDRVEVESSPLGEPFLSVVSRQFLSARFAPAELDGVPVKSRMRVEVFIRPMMK